MKNSKETIGNRTRDLPACNAVPQPTAPPRAPTFLCMDIYYKFILHVSASFGHHRARAYPDKNITRRKDNYKQNYFMFETVLPSSNFCVHIYIYIYDGQKKPKRLYIYNK